jgi:RND superfamily putative drug exporter
VTLVVPFMGMPSYAVEAVAMIGIGVGIDYALFIVTRYREGLADGMDPEAATVRAVETAGRAVLLAGSVVLIAVLGMFTVGLEMIRGLAVGISIGVFTTMVASVTLLPAVFGFVGTRIDRLSPPGTDPRARGPPPGAVAGVEPPDPAAPVARAGRGGRRAAGAGPARHAAAPRLRRRRQPPHHRHHPPGLRPHLRRFRPGANGPLVIVAELPGGPIDFTVLMGLRDRLDDLPEVRFATPPLLNDVGDAAEMQIFPTYSPQAEQTQALVHKIRGELIPQALEGSTVTARVTGATAGSIDFGEFVASRLPWFTGAVLVLSFLLLMVVFRSVLVPLKAVVLNLLSLGACYGVLVATFQWGWGIGLLGVGKPGPIDAWVPMMLFAVIFGLSMDYEVFLLSRIREDYERHHDNSAAVANGVAATARVITAAAA